MKQNVALFSALLALIGHSVFAQTDSLYTQQWNRDPVLKLNTTTSAQRQIITAEQIRVSGYNRLADVFQLIDGWTFTTTAGSNWMMQSNGTGNYDNQNWVLMVNGQRVELQRIFGLDVNMLGISVNEIERIEIVNSNGLYLGEYTQKGLIHIITRKNAEGLSYRGYYSNGISTMDQGRFREYPGAPSYINPIGLNTAHALGFKQGNFNITGSVNYQKYYSPDTAGLRRYERVSVDTTPHPLNTFINTRFEAQYTGKKMTHQLQFMYTGADQDPYNSYEKYERQFASLGYINQWNINERHQLRLSSIGTRDGYDWQRRQWQVNNRLSYRYLKPLKNGNFIWQSGLGYDRVDIFSLTVPENIFKPFTSVNIPVTRKANLFADGMVSVNGDLYAPKVSLGIYKRVSFLSNWSIVTGYAEQLGIEDFSRFYVMPAGFLSPYGGKYKSKQYSADLYYNLNIGNSLKFSYNSSVKSMNHESAMTFLYLISSAFPDGFVYSYPDYNSNFINWMNRFNIHYDIIKNLVFDVNYMRTGIVDRSVENIRTVPKHKITFTIQYELPKRITIWTRGYWQSETSWLITNLRPATDPYYITLNSFYTMDLGISKKLLKEYLNLNISIRNIFNSRQQYYPAAAQFDTRFTIGLTANIEGLFASRTPKP